MQALMSDVDLMADIGLDTMPMPHSVSDSIRKCLHFKSDL